MCAALTLFANILQHPDDPMAVSDLDLMSRVISTLGLLVVTGRIQYEQAGLLIAPNHTPSTKVPFASTKLPRNMQDRFVNILEANWYRVGSGQPSAQL